MRSEKRFTVVWHVDESVEHELRHCCIFFLKETGSAEGREGKKGREKKGEKEIKRGRLGGGAHEGEAFTVLCCKWKVRVVTTTFSSTGPARITQLIPITPRDHISRNPLRVVFSPGFISRRCSPFRTRTDV